MLKKNFSGIAPGIDVSRISPSQGLQIVGINVDVKTDDARSFLASTPARFAIAFDQGGSTPRAYGVKGMPSSVLIGPDGKVLYEHSGFRPADRDALESRIKAALGGPVKAFR